MPNQRIKPLCGGLKPACKTCLVSAASTGLAPVEHPPERESHVVGILGTNVSMGAVWDSTRYEMRPYPAGSIGLFPKDGELVVEATAPYEETLISIDDKSLQAAGGDHIDVSRIQFKLADIKNPVVTNAAHVIRSLGQMGVCNEWPIIFQSAKVALTASVIMETSPEANMRFSKNSGGLSAERKRRVMEYIEANLSRQISLAELAGVAGMSEFHFSRSFSKSVGLSPMRYMMARRVKEAKRMLRSTHEPLAHIAAACGFASQSHMTTVFKQVIKATPSQYRKGS